MPGFWRPAPACPRSPGRQSSPARGQAPVGAGVPATPHQMRLMLQAAAPTPLSNWRLAALGVLVAAIIVTPFILLQQATRNADDAWRAVSHSQQVEATVQGLAADMRNLE